MDDRQPVMVGVDLGGKSIGWAVLACSPDANGRWEPTGLRDAGVRCFDAGVDGNLEQGKDEARAVARRLQRRARLQSYRHAQRLRRSLRSLAECGLLPGAVASPPQARHAYLLSLDQRLKELMLAEGESAHPVQDSPIYQLRRRCLTENRSLEEIGRALFHLAQRRGFKSNRKDASKEDEKGKVKGAIAELAKLIEASGCRTLGGYFSTLDPRQQRIRNRWTARSMYEMEFDAIWESQAPHHPVVMTEEARYKIHKAIFHQRRLKSCSHLIGFCELETQRRRAPMGCLVFQRFRIVQKINELTWRDEKGRICGPLGIDDPRRKALIDLLDTEGDLSIDEAKKMLGLHKVAAFVLEKGATKTLPGNRTVAKLKPKLLRHWNNWSPAQHEMFVNELISGIDQDIWRKRLVKHWGLSEVEADNIADVGLQNSYTSLSRRAMRRLLVEMETGTPLAAAKKKLYGDRVIDRPALETLPGVLRPETRRFLGRIGNPALLRSLTELRKVVNAIIRKWGKPVQFHIELARDIRNSRQQRQDIAKKVNNRIGEREGFRKQMAETLPHRFASRAPSQSDLEKWALAEECAWVCPYTGKAITPESLLGAHAEFEVEPIIPRSRRPDDSFINKTLCHRGEILVKENKTPFERFHGTARWDEIIGRVKRFQGLGARAKLRLFQVEKTDDRFTNRDLNDTRYASRLAKDYLGLLYGGCDGVDEAGKRCVQASCGRITSMLFHELKLNPLMGDAGPTNHQDHRDHAVYAVIIALAGPRAVQMLAAADGNASAGLRHRHTPLAEPWRDFRTGVQTIVDRIVVSHRLDQTLSGALHEATNFSARKTHINRKTGKTEAVRHVRKKLVGITLGQIKNVVDPGVKKAVLAFLNGRDPKVVFKDDSEVPTLPNRRIPERPVPIRRVRVWEKNKVISIGSNGEARHVVAGENIHLEIVTGTDRRGKEVWDISNIVSRYEANRRRCAGESIVKRDWGEGEKLRMVLRKGDYLQIDIEGLRELVRVTSICSGEIQCYRPHDARPSGMVHPDRKLGRFRSGSAFAAVNPHKVCVSPIGEIRPCND